MKTRLNELALFAGVGGGILGGKLLGWRTVCAVEWDAYARDVLVARQNDGCLDPFPIWDDIQTFDGRPWRGRVDVVSGGFPCQDISCAGKGAGIEGSRSSMWKHMARIIGEVRPQYAFVENSPMLVGRGLSVVLADLAEMGYDAKWGIVGAHHVSAPHKRDRIWIVANSNSHANRLEVRRSMGEEATKQGEDRQDESASRNTTRTSNDERINSLLGLEQIAKESYCDVTNPTLPRFQENEHYGDESEISMLGGDCNVYNPYSTQRQGNQCSQRIKQKHANTCSASWWASEPNVGRVANGVVARVDRLRCIGNGQVPAVVSLAWNILSSPDQSGLARL